MKAVWGLDYDMHEDKCFKRPCCPDPECMNAPIWKYEDGKYHCFSCQEEVEVDDPEMIEWFSKREETKVEYGDCHVVKDKNGKVIFGCGGKGCFERHYVRNLITLEWQQAYGGCSKCGTRFIV